MRRLEGAADAGSRKDRPEKTCSSDTALAMLEENTGWVPESAGRKAGPQAEQPVVLRADRRIVGDLPNVRRHCIGSGLQSDVAAVLRGYDALSHPSL